MSIRILTGDCIDTMATLPDGCVQCCVTSPPYYGHRDYGVTGQIGAESSICEYVARLVAVFRDVRRVLRGDGTLWLNLGDAFGTGKQLLLIPYRVALALQADGWVLRQSIVWHKPNVMPDGAKDRPTTDHEAVFLFAKSSAYFFNADAIAEHREEDSIEFERRHAAGRCARKYNFDRQDNERNTTAGFVTGRETRNCRSVWSIATQKLSGFQHFAPMPSDLAERCIKAGSRPGDTVLDPFSGAGTTGLVADRLQRNAILCELNPAYVAMARNRIIDDAPLLVAAE